MRTPCAKVAPNLLDRIRTRNTNVTRVLHGLRAHVSAAGAAPRSPRAAPPLPLANSSGEKRMAPRTHRGEQKNARTQKQMVHCARRERTPCVRRRQASPARAAGVTAPPSSAAKRLPRPPRSPTPTPSTPRARSTAGRSAGRPSPPTCSRAPAGRRARRACRCARRRLC